MLLTALNLNTFLEEPLSQNIIVPVAKIVLILLAVLIAKKATKKLIQKKVNTANKKKTQFIFAGHLLNGIIYFLGGIAVVMSIPSLSDIALTVFAGSGIIALIIGFASQQTFSNIISGIFISIFKPFRVGDRINFIGKGFTGFVEDITLRHTVIRTFENKRIIVPNAVINDEMIENADLIDEKICNMIDFSISYDSDIDKAIKIINEEVKKHDFFFDNRNEEEKEKGIEPVITRLISFQDSSVKLRTWAWAQNPSDAFVLKCDINKTVKERFDKEGIEIPFPYRTIVYKDKGNPRP